MRSKGTPTKYPGVYMINPNRFYLRAKVSDERTGQRKEIDKVVEAESAREADALRADMISSYQTGLSAGRVKVGEFARSWIASKARLVDKYTLGGYVDALEDHVLPVLGEFYYDALRPLEVQAWVNDCLNGSWRSRHASKEAKARSFSVRSVHSWFRVLRNMTRDAVAQLDLPRDPTNRIKFPEADQRDGNNALSGEQLAKFLDAMKQKYPRHYAFTATLAFTGLRFCHASALKWEDIDEEKCVIRVQRKQTRGVVGPVSRRKRAPRELPLVPELAEILREHRRLLVEKQVPGVNEGWVFPSDAGTLRVPASMVKPWKACCTIAGIKDRFTVHGLRRTFNDLARRAGVDAVVTKSITGHVTEQMREHYSSVDLSEKREAIANVVRLVPRSVVGEKVGESTEKKKAG